MRSAPRAAATGRTQSGYEAFLTAPDVGSLIELVLHENGAAGDDKVAGLEAVANLHSPVLLHPDLHLPALQDHRLALNPNHRLLAFPDHRFRRDRGRILACAGRNLEARKHFRLEHVTWVRNLRAHNDPARRGIRGRADRNHLRVEDAIRQRRDLDLELLTHTAVRDV